MAVFGKFHPKTGFYHFFFFLQTLNTEIFSKLWNVYQIEISKKKKKETVELQSVAGLFVVHFEWMPSLRKKSEYPVIRDFAS